MKKKVHIFVIGCCVYCMIFLGFITYEKSENREKNANNTSMTDLPKDNSYLLTQESGKKDDSMISLVAEELLGVSLKNIVPTDDILSQQGKWKEQYNQLKVMTDELLIQPHSAFFDEEGYYISKIPIFYYNFIEKKVSEQAQILVFSKDFTKVANVAISLNTDDIVVNLYFEWNKKICTLMKENPQEEFIFIRGINGSLVLDSENVVRYVYPAMRYEINGDCYQMLYKDWLAVSYEELTAEENLIWIQQ